MTHEEYYKIAEEKIGQYDAYGFRCKQWLTVIITALIVAAFHKPDQLCWLIPLGIGAIFLVYLVDMAFQAVCMRLINYCRKLEEVMSQAHNIDVSNPDMAIGHNVSLPARRDDWYDYLKFLYSVSLRVRGLPPYIAAMIIMLVGILMAASK